MSGLKKFIASGAEEADCRVAAALAPPSLEAADRYLKASAVATAIDRVTIRLQQWWLSSEVQQWCATIGDGWRLGPLSSRRRAVAMIVVIAVGMHVTLTLLQGAHFGWFWLIIPAMAALFAAVLLAATRQSGEAK